MKKLIAIAVAVVLVLPMAAPALAEQVNIVPDASFESSAKGLHRFASDDYGFGGGIAEHTTADSHSGRQCVLLEATGRDQSKVGGYAAGKRYFSDITDWGFWYKHYGTPNTDLTPNILLHVTIEGGAYDGGELVLFQQSSRGQGYNYNWTWFDNDKWWYGVSFHGDLVDWGADLTLAQIQSVYDGTVNAWVVAIGFVSGSETARVLVDDLEVNVSKK